MLSQKYGDAPKMLTQASMPQHFLTLTASNGSPLKALLRRGFARGETSEQTEQRVHGEGKARAAGFLFSAPGAGLEQALVSVSSNYMLWKFRLRLKGAPLDGARVRSTKDKEEEDRKASSPFDGAHGPE